MKYCKNCNIEKNDFEFYVGKQRGAHGQVWEYLDSICKICRKLYGANRRKNTKQQIIDYLGGQCSQCGLIDDPIVYDCHHIDEQLKDFSISKVSGKSFKSLQPELDKCILLCCICHRKIHYGCL